MGRAASFLGAGLLLAGLAPGTVAAEPQQGDVVLEFDFSGSILDDERTRNRFGDAINAIADRVDATSRDLIEGSTTVSLVQFASQAADVEGCTELELFGSPAKVRAFSACLRKVAADYKSGGNATLRGTIGRDTNYVAAMQRAATHLPENAERPALIFFSDGRHDVAGTPVAAVGPARDELVASHDSFALLPVGLAVNPAGKTALEAGLDNLRTIKDFKDCSGADFAWPDVAFDTPDAAGNAVALGLQNATCTFTAEVTPPPTEPPPAAVHNIRLTPQDGKIEVRWTPPAATALDGPVVDYRVRCTPAEGDPVESGEGESTERQTVVEGLTNGVAYSCEVAADTATTQGDWTEAGGTATPAEIPGAPDKPKVEALSGAVRVSTTQPDGSIASAYRYECSPDNGASWPATADAIDVEDTTAQVGGLANGTTYVCRAIAYNDSGESEASPLSDAFRPCGGFLECNGLTIPVIGAVGGLLLAALLVGLFFLLRGGGGRRGGGYTLAVVDVVHTANLGGGSTVGLSFVGAPRARQLDGIVAAKGRKADVKIRRLRNDRFRVEDKHGANIVLAGEPIVVSDASGVRHELVLRAFEGKAASAVATRR
ncbi:MAG TPA: fibronectin type III domain-containing protein [Candidatus Limnocylindrales bacterium]|nr:fibronectin type III domain-containing protein [Candidatus Limnocylindrales bacterium]